MKNFNYKDHKTTIAAALLVLCFLLGVLITYLLTPKVDKDKLCEFELDQVEVLNGKLASLQKEHLVEKTNLTTQMQLDARSECLKKIDNYKKLCETLRCQICNKAKK